MFNSSGSWGSASLPRLYAVACFAGLKYLSLDLSRSPKRPSGVSVRVLAILEHLHAVHEDVLHADRVLVRLFEGRSVGDSVRSYEIFHLFHLLARRLHILFAEHVHTHCGGAALPQDSPGHLSLFIFDEGAFNSGRKGKTASPIPEQFQRQLSCSSCH